MNKTNQRRGSSASGARVDIKKPSKDLFSTQADEYAQLVHDAGGRHQNKRTQLRRFYDELEMWYSQVFSLQLPQQREEKLNEVLPFIQMLIAKAAYAEGRRHIDKTFESFFADLIKQIDTLDDLRNAKLFMEAFMGFYRKYGSD